MKVFCLAPNLHANGARLNFKSGFRPAALACSIKRENFKNFVTHEQVAKTINREAVSARRAGSACRGAKTASVAPIDRAASENILNFAPLKHCADRKNFKIFASDEMEFTTHGEPKPATHSMVKFAARRRLKFEPCGTAARGFAMRDKFYPKGRAKAAQALKFHRGAEKKQNEI